MAISTQPTSSVVASHSGSIAASKQDDEVSIASITSREALIKALEMNEELCVHGSLSEKGILHAFAKYQEINKAYTCVQNTKDWPGRKPLRQAIIELCMSKSQFYDDFHPLFSKALKHDELMGWLKQEKDCLSGYELFGVEKIFYSKPDLERWMDSKKVKGKGKQKEISKKKGKLAESSKRSHKKQ
jgi:hypothetical protein